MRISTFSASWRIILLDQADHHNWVTRWKPETFYRLHKHVRDTVRCIDAWGEGRAPRKKVNRCRLTIYGPLVFSRDIISIWRNGSTIILKIMSSKYWRWGSRFRCRSRGTRLACEKWYCGGLRCLGLKWEETLPIWHGPSRDVKIDLITDFPNKKTLLKLSGHTYGKTISYHQNSLPSWSRNLEIASQPILWIVTTIQNAELH